MSGPLYPVTCPIGQWTLIAGNVKVGNIYKKSTNPTVYYQTYRVTGENPPTSKDEGVAMFADTETREEISSSYSIDVYVWCENYEGILRVDI